jgi:thioredoxin reductase (NADPH)
MDINRPVTHYDALVIGGGPAGLTAAIYLARARRTVAVFDCERTARSDWGQINHNVPGFPDGISILELSDRGRKQAERFGARFFDTEVVTLQCAGDGFDVTSSDCAFRGSAVVIATGVTDSWARFPGHEEYIGRSMHWCIVCDGYEMEGQRVVVVGNDGHAAELAIQMLRYKTEEVTVVTNSGALGISPCMTGALHRHGIRLVVGRIAGARARAKGEFEALLLEGGEEIPLDHLFCGQGAEPNTALARSLGVELNEQGYIRVDTEAHTSVNGVFAAGDVTRLFAHQVVTATHEGSAAATALDNYLFKQDQEQARVGSA